MDLSNQIRAFDKRPRKVFVVQTLLDVKESLRSFQEEILKHSSANNLDHTAKIEDILMKISQFEVIEILLYYLLFIMSYFQ